jgi:hypothetical protein
MKKYIISEIVLLLIGIAVFAQNTDCNRAVWVKQDEKKIPEGICIPKGYLISNIYESADINDDGLPDFIFKWRKPDLQDGDTLYVTIYTQNQDSTFSYLRTFNNLYPINFKSYSLDYIPKDEKFRAIYKKYHGQYPFLKLTFEKDIIQINRKGDATADLIITYRYDKDLKNWRYEKTEMYDFVANTKEPYDLSEELGPTIDNFTYFIWDQENK